MEQYIMALDQGTTSSRCILFNRQGEICGMAQKEFTQLYPRAGWVEHNPTELWSSQISVAAEVMATLGVQAAQIAAIGITNQRETVVVWDKRTGAPVYPAIVWQCRRTAEQIDRLNAEGFGAVLRKKTGLIPDAYFSASKLAWILEQVPGARREAEAGNLLFGTVDTWLIWNLTGGQAHLTDETNASRTMLFDIHKMDWDDEILAYFKIPRGMLPQVLPSGAFYGVTHNGALGGEIPIYGVAGDQQAALFGQCCFLPGEMKNTYGTGCFLLMNTGTEPKESKHGLLTTVAASVPVAAGAAGLGSLAGAAGVAAATGGGKRKPVYALEGSVFVGGAAVQWLRDGLRMIRTAAESEAYANAVPDTNGVYVVPAFAGLGAPYWDAYARGTITGMTRGTSKEHIIRAVLESIAYQSYDVMHAMELDSGIPIRDLKVDGGASGNQFLMQFQADLLGTSVQRPACIETTALGAAYLAGLASGYWHGTEEIQENWKQERLFRGRLSESQRKELLAGWQHAVESARFSGQR